ncbi:FxLD family lanthipeptide [Yinghuangia sp. YIM S09857]|uniref:FxLD family lanthipeptide n=1 Tax=Yinghuangia sp. YIM S09857 TaxID=3436929 RepID=UPI003F52BFE6
MPPTEIVERAVHAPVQTEDAEGEFAPLDIRLIEVVDPAGLVNVTDDNCGSSCPTACATNVA